MRSARPAFFHPTPGPGWPHPDSPKPKPNPNLRALSPAHHTLPRAPHHAASNKMSISVSSREPHRFLPASASPFAAGRSRRRYVCSSLTASSPPLPPLSPLVALVDATYADISTEPFVKPYFSTTGARSLSTQTELAARARRRNNNLQHRTTTPLHHSTPLHHGTIAPLHRTTAPRHRTTAPFHHCTTASLHHCTAAPPPQSELAARVRSRGSQPELAAGARGRSLWPELAA